MITFLLNIFVFVPIYVEEMGKKEKAIENEWRPKRNRLKCLRALLANDLVMWKTPGDRLV